MKMISNKIKSLLNLTNKKTINVCSTLGILEAVIL